MPTTLDTAANSLHLAVAQGNAFEVARLLDSGVPVDARDARGNTALHVAAQRGGPAAIVEHLIKCGANVNVENGQGRTPLCVALDYSKGDVDEQLRNYGAKEHTWTIDEISHGDQGRTLLHTAARLGRVREVEQLLATGAAVDTQDIKGKTALHLAAKYGHTAIVEQLLNYGADVNIVDRHGRTPMTEVIERGHWGGLGLLAEHGASMETVDESGQTAFHLAARNGVVSAVERALAGGIPVGMPDTDGQTALCLAAEQGHAAIVELLLYHSADADLPNNDGQTALHLAAQGGHTSVVDLLTAEHRQVDIVDRTLATPLHLAAENGHVAVVELLLSRGAEANMVDDFLRTPLHNAASRAYPTQCREVDGRTTVTMPVEYEHTIRLLLDHGAPVNAQDRDMKTALHYAASNGEDDIARQLLIHGAEVGVIDRDGYTPMGLVVARSTADWLYPKRSAQNMVQLLESAAQQRNAGQQPGKHARGEVDSGPSCKRVRRADSQHLVDPASVSPPAPRGPMGRHDLSPRR